MSRGAIRFEEVWKKFRYGEVHTRLRDAIPALARRWLGRPDPDAGLWTGEFWALRDVSFSVAPGEALGLIGPNGAGKSTVLKLLTGIMQPTAGRAEVQGRVGALIEVAAGFHPDLTGRENVFLQGVIMGMPRREISGKFDQIVEFSGIAPFIDTPVKRYSSGMQARLGFAIAAHLEPEVLLIDEVLAVGDAAFQVKAFARIAELVRQELPVVVVSHQLDAISTLCGRALLLDRGEVRCAGTPDECIAAYLGGPSARPPAPGDGALRVEELVTGAPALTSGEWLTVELRCLVRPGGWVEPEGIRLRLRAVHSGQVLWETGTRELGLALPAAGDFAIRGRLQLNVPRGTYLLESLARDEVMGRETFQGPAATIEVREGVPCLGVAQLNARLSLGTDRDREAGA